MEKKIDLNIESIDIYSIKTDKIVYNYKYPLYKIMLNHLGPSYLVFVA